MLNYQSEVMVHYKDIYAGTIDLLCSVPTITTKLAFDEELHCYTLNGKQLSSVTKLLDDGSYNNVDPTILQQACDRGHEIHKELEIYFKTGQLGDTREFYEAISIIEKNKELLSEPSIIDFKTYKQATQKNKEKCLKQEIMYGKAVKELTGIEIKNYLMIHLPKGNKGKLINLGGIK
jgi:hypothetical protein